MLVMARRGDDIYVNLFVAGRATIEAPDQIADIADRLFNHERVPRHDEDKSPLKLCVRGTNFQIRVWRALLNIAPGRLATYGAIADAIGQPSAARAVGSAIGANPIGYLIPCHRVIKATGLMDTNYRWGPARKLASDSWAGRFTRSFGGFTRECRTDCVTR